MVESKKSIPTYYPMGEQAIVVQFENEISIEVSQRIQSLVNVIEKEFINGVSQLIPAFNNLTVCYDPMIIDYSTIMSEIDSLISEISSKDVTDRKTIYIPVAFGGEYGPDLGIVAERAGMSPCEVVEILQSRPFYVFSVGFIAGYPYCGEIDESLQFPRRNNPRALVPKGSIQIVNNLTGIFTMDAPSGWHVIGWSPMELFNPHFKQPSIIQAGDYIKYKSVSVDEVEKWNEKKQREWNEEWDM